MRLLEIDERYQRCRCRAGCEQVFSFDIVLRKSRITAEWSVKTACVRFSRWPSLTTSYSNFSASPVHRTSSLSAQSLRISPSNVTKSLLGRRNTLMPWLVGIAVAMLSGLLLQIYKNWYLRLRAPTPLLRSSRSSSPTLAFITYPPTAFKNQLGSRKSPGPDWERASTSWAIAARRNIWGESKRRRPIRKSNRHCEQQRSTPSSSWGTMLKANLTLNMRRQLTATPCCSQSLRSRSHPATTSHTGSPSSRGVSSISSLLKVAASKKPKSSTGNRPRLMPNFFSALSLTSLRLSWDSALTMTLRPVGSATTTDSCLRPTSALIWYLVGRCTMAGYWHSSLRVALAMQYLSSSQPCPTHPSAPSLFMCFSSMNSTASRQGRSGVQRCRNTTSSWHIRAVQSSKSEFSCRRIWMVTSLRDSTGAESHNSSSSCICAMVSLMCPSLQILSTSRNVSNARSSSSRLRWVSGCEIECPLKRRISSYDFLQPRKLVRVRSSASKCARASRWAIRSITDYEISASVKSHNPLAGQNSIDSLASSSSSERMALSLSMLGLSDDSGCLSSRLPWKSRWQVADESILLVEQSLTLNLLKGWACVSTCVWWLGVELVFLSLGNVYLLCFVCSRLFSFTSSSEGSYFSTFAYGFTSGLTSGLILLRRESMSTADARVLLLSLTSI